MEAKTTGALSFASAESKPDETSSAGIRKHAWYDLQLIGDSLMDERMLWFLGHAGEGMGEISECLDIASRIEAGNSASWMREWFKTADRLLREADTVLAKGHKISAGELYLRAASYYLAGLIYSEQPGDEIRQRVRLSAKCFETALDLLSIPGKAVNIPYENSTLPGYFFRSPATSGPAPILIVHQGMDASVEEDLFLAQGAIKRGYHCLLFHHPGQGLALRDRGLTFRPDWENVMTPVLDFAVKLPGVDPQKIIVMGLSFGGALVTRAAAFEKRINICIANPAVHSWWDFISVFLFGDHPELEQLLDQDPEGFNGAIDAFLGNAPDMYKWWFRSASWKFGASSPADLLTKLRQYTNADIVDKVTCKVLVMDGEGETWAAQQAKKLYDALQCSKTYMLFTAKDTGLLHCQTGAMAVASQRMFDWLDENIER